MTQIIFLKKNLRWSTLIGQFSVALPTCRLLDFIIGLKANLHTLNYSCKCHWSVTILKEGFTKVNVFTSTSKKNLKIMMVMLPHGPMLLHPLVTSTSRSSTIPRDNIFGHLCSYCCCWKWGTLCCQNVLSATSLEIGFLSPIQNVVLGYIKSFSQLDHQVDIT